MREAGEQRAYIFARICTKKVQRFLVVHHKIKHTINNVVICATNEQKIKRAGIVQNLHKTHVLIRMMV
ncbi:hypothetical protein D9D10_17180 [Raoultella ornithinolytica]|nr:hypothetical protein D9D10_17180 [Raoultella ornithinolytica]